jgi:hypothetical protein
MRLTNPIAAENARAGTHDWQLERPALAREIEGYASATSVERGTTIALYVNTRAPAFVLEVFRIGWYAGAGARRVFGPLHVAGTVQPEPEMHADTGLVDCAWTHPFVLTTADPSGNAWPSGVYLARLSARDGDDNHDGAQSYVIFVVRDDARRADLLVQLPVTTWQAYNTWGGKSLYRWGSTGPTPGRSQVGPAPSGGSERSERGGTGPTPGRSQGGPAPSGGSERGGKKPERASKVSFNRPYAVNAQNPAAAYGVGAGEFLTNLQPHPDTYGTSNAGWDINLVRWLEREGRDVAYCTNLDTHARPPTTARCKAWLSSGHDEYWSWAMREHVEQARDAGVHLAFFGSNAAYWQIRLEPSAASRTADRVMVCHKKAERDPFAGTPFVTDRWRSEAVNRPEEALVGVMYDADPVDGDIVIAAPVHWLFDGTGLERGSVLRGLLGYEVDSMQGGGPTHIEVLAASPWTISGKKPREGIAHMTLSTAPGGTLVFATGSMQWAWGLDDFNAPALRPARSSAAAERMTRNLLARFVG